ncbi:1705_t:CDS:1, partial [Dentiscutata erythropus]
MTSRTGKKNFKKAVSEETPIEIILINKISDHISDEISRLKYDTTLSSTFCVKLNEATLNTISTDVRVIAKLIVDKIEK